MCPFQFSWIFQSCHLHTGHLLRGARCRTARAITLAQPTSQASAPSSERLWDELCARDGETDSAVPLPSLTRFTASPVSRDTNMEQHGRGHPSNPRHEESVHKGLDVSLGTGSFVHLNRFLSRDGKSPRHFLIEKRTLSPERQPRLHTSATTITKTDLDADIVWKVLAHGWY